MEKQTVSFLLETIKNTLTKIDLLERADTVVSLDMMTVCPEKGIEGAGEVSSALCGDIFALMHSEEFTGAVGALHARRDELSGRDLVLADELYTGLMREKNITPEQNRENLNAKNRAWAAWITAKENKDFSRFEQPLSELIASEKKRVMSWEPLDERQAAMTAYDRMLSEFERGITSAEIDALFEESRKRITALLGRIVKSEKKIRTDFLSRRVTREQQERLSEYLLKLMGFDSTAGALAESEHPFTQRVCGDDVRITTHYYEDNFIFSFYSIMHEGGHALFEQMQPREDIDGFIGSRKTMGMHESVSRFYENIIGRSRAFIYYVYPELCEIFPQVFFDVTAQELYEAVNNVTPSLIRMAADELTYTLHIIIRYETEKMFIGGELAVSDIPKVWNEKYREYLGVVPGDDAEGALQDSHWSSDFGYFPTYALGNFYNAMYYGRMKDSADIGEALGNGDLTPINNWMKEHVFTKANILDPKDWIKDITGEELTASYFLDYLEEKYAGIYKLNEETGDPNRHFEDYVQRLIKVRRLSAPLIDNISTPDDYRLRLAENFRKIGDLAAENRAVVSGDIEPILHSHELLTEKEIEQIRALNLSLMDANEHDNIDLPVMLPLSERLMEDAKKKHDDGYLIRQLDEQMIAAIAMIVQTRRVISAPQITEAIRNRSREMLEELLSYLDKDKFLKLDMECRTLVMINSRYGDGIFVSMSPLTPEERRYRFRLMIRSLRYACDPFYRDALPDYDWTYHIYRIYQYISSYDEFDNCAGFDEEELRAVSDCGDAIEKLWLSDREKFEKIDTFGYIHTHTIRNRMHAGRLSPQKYAEHLYRMYRKRDSKLYEVDNIVENIEIPREYLAAIKKGHITEKHKLTAENMYRSALSYIFNIPKTGIMYELMDYYAPFLFEFIEFPGGITFEEMGLRSFAAMHPPTYIHSMMVAKITRCLTYHLLKEKPEVFVGMPGCDDVQSVKKNRDMITAFAYHAALCHDFGKLIIIDTVSVYGRDIFDSEFEIIKEHPALGAMLLEKHGSTKAYADVARGHHIWYNGERGYPGSFDITANPYRAVIALTACADCMDAATDRVGRSYKGGKTLDEYTAEVGERSGTQYAPYLHDLLIKEEVHSDIEYLLTSGRQQTYRDTYLLLKRVRAAESI